MSTLQKKFGNALIFFFFWANKIKICSIICSTFSGWMIAWLYTLKEMYLVALIMRLSWNDFKIWKFVERQLLTLCIYVFFFCFFFFIVVVVVVNIWIFLFIRLYNLCFLRNILKKISRAITRVSRQAVPLVYLGNQQKGNQI